MKSWIYAILDEQNITIYVGSCKRNYFCQRIGDHRKPSNARGTPLLKYVESHGGWTKFRFQILEEHEAITKENLLEREKHFILVQCPICNKNRPITTIEEKLCDRRITSKQWRTENPDKTLLQRQRARTKDNYRKKVNERITTKINCPCGGVYSLQNKTNHYNRNIHKQYEVTTNNEIPQSEKEMESHL